MIYINGVAVVGGDMFRATYDPDLDGQIALAQLVAAVCSETEADNKIAAQNHPVVVRKTADQTVNNSEVLVNDTHLLHALLANEVWYYEFVLLGRSRAGDDFDFTIVVPGGASGSWWIINKISVLEAETYLEGTAFATEDKVAGRSDTITQIILLSALVVNGATPGDVQLQWAQSTAAGVDTKIMTDSHLKAYKIG